jgi:hypothetical protein
MLQKPLHSKLFIILNWPNNMIKQQTLNMNFMKVLTHKPKIAKLYAKPDASTNSTDQNFLSLI